MATSDAATESGALLGSWTLISFVRRIDWEFRTHMLGDHPAGLISYQPDGHMSAILMKRDRPWSDGRKFLESSVEQQASAASVFSAYGGRYTVGDGVVTHHVEVSLWPEHVGADLVRTISWDQGDLLLTTAPLSTPSGRRLDDQLRWRRVAAP
jgi:hypothetical protein